MENTIKLLASIANQLDEQGLAALASRVDAVASNALNIKVAQYVGMQGYAIRNSRCWGNCYRKKRLETPTKAAQQVWTECHAEYVESINNDGSKWDKYASRNEPFVKTASAIDKYNEIDKRIAEVIDQKLASGLDLGNAIFASVEDVANIPQEQAIAASNELLEIASELVSKPHLANRLSEAAQGLLKEAGPMDFFRGIGQGISNWAGNTAFIGKLKYIREQLSQSGKQFQDSFAKAQAAWQTSKQLFKETENTLSNVANSPTSTPQQKQYATSALQAISVANNAPTDVDFGKALPKVMQSLDAVLKGNFGPQQGGPQQGGGPAGGPQPPAGGGPAAPQAPAGPVAPQAPQAPQAPKAPKAPAGPVAPQAPAAVNPVAPAAPAAPAAAAPAAAPAAVPPVAKPAAPAANKPAAPAANPAAAPAAKKPFLPGVKPAAKPKNASLPTGVANNQVQSIPVDLFEEVWKLLRSQQKGASSEPYFKLANLNPSPSSNPLATKTPKQKAKDVIKGLDPETIKYLQSLDATGVQQILDWKKRLQGSQPSVPAQKP